MVYISRPRYQYISQKKKKKKLTRRAHFVLLSASRTSKKKKAHHGILEYIQQTLDVYSWASVYTDWEHSLYRGSNNNCNLWNCSYPEFFY